jgi:hypothetical protein
VPVARVAARAAAARCGEARREPARAGEAAAGRRGGTWREERRRRVAGARHMAIGAAGSGASKNRGGEGLEVDEGDLFAIS